LTKGYEDPKNISLINSLKPVIVAAAFIKIVRMSDFKAAMNTPNLIGGNILNQMRKIR
jgi:hypothetical protein